MGPKKPKLTKKQIEEMKALQEQERLAQEALDKKRAEEEAERQRIAEEKRRAEEEKRQKEEKIRLDEQAPQYDERSSKMYEMRQEAARKRVRDLDEKYLGCDPLPDPENEKDLTTFIRLWVESKDKTLKEALANCQTAEQVIKSINLILAEAKSQNDTVKINWCNRYINELREITLKKFDDISVNILTYFEEYSKITDEERELERKNNPSQNRGQQQTVKQLVMLDQQTPDLMFAIWGNVTAKNVQFNWLKFGDYWETMIPPKDSKDKLIMRCMWSSYDYITTSEAAKTANSIVVGGVAHNRMYEFPAGQRQAAKWVMRKIHSTEDTLKYKPYPPSANAAEPVQTHFTLPDYVYTHEKDEPKIGVWDEETQAWSTESVTEIEFDRVKRMLEFSLTRFAPVAYLQAKTTDYPYDSWCLRSIAQEVAILTIVTKRIEINIEIKPLCVRLIEMDSIPQLAHIANKDMHPGMLLMELSRCGIHMMPEDNDAEMGGIHLKDRDAEERAIIDIAQTVKAFAFQSIKWNQAAPAENIVCRMRENPDYFRRFLEDDESDWKSLCWWNNKVSFIKARNCDDAYNANILEGQVTHNMLSLATKGVWSDTAAETSQYVFDIEFMDTVVKVLRMTRLLSFTTHAFDKRTLEEQQQ